MDISVYQCTGCSGAASPRCRIPAGRPQRADCNTNANSQRQHRRFPAPAPPHDDAGDRQPAAGEADPAGRPGAPDLPQRDQRRAPIAPPPASTPSSVNAPATQAPQPVRAPARPKQSTSERDQDRGDAGDQRADGQAGGDRRDPELRPGRTAVPGTGSTRSGCQPLEPAAAARAGGRRRHRRRTRTGHGPGWRHGRSRAPAYRVMLEHVTRTRPAQPGRARRPRRLSRCRASKSWPPGRAARCSSPAISGHHQRGRAPARCPPRPAAARAAPGRAGQVAAAPRTPAGAA